MKNKYGSVSCRCPPPPPPPPPPMQYWGKTPAGSQRLKCLDAEHHPHIFYPKPCPQRHSETALYASLGSVWPSKALRDSFIRFSWICVTLKGTPRQLYTLLLDLCDPQRHSETALYASLGSVWPSKALRDSFIRFSWICVTLKGTPRQLYTLLLDLCDPQRHSETALYASLGSVWPSKALRDSFIHFSWICVTLKGTPRQLYTLLLDLCDPQRHSETALYTSLGSVWISRVAPAALQLTKFCLSRSGRIFFFRVNLLCWLLFWYLFHPCVTAVECKTKRSQPFGQKCRWQLGYS